VVGSSRQGVGIEDAGVEVVGSSQQGVGSEGSSVEVVGSSIQSGNIGEL
jgi:hypothetical protein